MADEKTVHKPQETKLELEMLHRQLQKMGALYQVGQILTASLDLPTRLDNVVDLAIRLLGADRGSIMLLDSRKDELELVTSRGLKSEAANARVPIGQGIAGWVAEHRQPLILHDVVSDERFKGTDPQVTSALAIPLMAEDRLIGVLNISTLREHRFTEEDLEYLSAFADLGAVAIENALLYHRLRHKQEELEKELSLASRIQQSIIAKHVPCAAVKLIARLMPASAVGGDFYSVIPLAKDSKFCFYCSPRIQDQCQTLRSEFCPNKFGIMIGDVANKGLPAALIMAVLTTSLYELGKNHTSPGIILSEANSTFRRCFHESQYNFATLFYGFFDGTTHSFTYSKAGHDAPLLVRGDTGELESLEAEGYPLGLKEDGEFEERTLVLKRGDRLILFTDGLTGRPQFPGGDLRAQALHRIRQGAPRQRHRDPPRPPHRRDHDLHRRRPPARRRRRAGDGPGGGVRPDHDHRYGHQGDPLGHRQRPADPGGAGGRGHHDPPALPGGDNPQRHGTRQPLRYIEEDIHNPEEGRRTGLHQGQGRRTGIRL